MEAAAGDCSSPRSTEADRSSLPRNSRDPRQMLSNLKTRFGDDSSLHERLQLSAAALLGLYAVGWLAFGLYVFTAGVSSGDIVFLLLTLGWCVGFAWLGLRHPLAAGTLLLVPCTFPIGLVLAGLTGASATVDVVLVLAWFVAFPLVTAIAFIAAGLLGLRERRLLRRPDFQVRPRVAPRR
jgi:hypothetical protein